LCPFFILLSIAFGIVKPYFPLTMLQ
jgi:hypothetical protein